MEKLKDESVDVLITDPPYWTLDKWRNVGTTTRLGGHREKDKQREEMFFQTINYEHLWQFFLEVDRVLKLDGHLYLFCDDIVQPIVCHWIREAQGEHRFGECHTLVWDKVNMGMGYHYRRQYEFIVFCWRLKRDGVGGFKPRKLANLGIPDILRAPRVTNRYPAEKPESLMRTVVEQSLHAGEMIVDPFAGSGVVGAVVAPEKNCKVLLNDISPAAIAYMNERLVEKKQKTMF